MTARSRLKPEAKETTSNKVEHSHSKRTRKRYRENTINPYITHLPLLLLAIPFYIVVYYILNNISPAKIAHIPLQNSYLLLITPFFIAIYSTVGYVFLNTKRGFATSLLLSILLFLKLQNFSFDIWWLLPLLAIFLIITIIFSKKTSSNTV